MLDCARAVGALDRLDFRDRRSAELARLSRLPVAWQHIAYGRDAAAQTCLVRLAAAHDPGLRLDGDDHRGQQLGGTDADRPTRRLSDLEHQPHSHPAAADRRSRSRRGDCQPVSYTHLTLPTIY